MQVRWLIKRRPVTTTGSVTLQEAARLLTDEDVSALVVIVNDQPAAIVSERDIVVAVAGGMSLDSPVSAVMVPAPLVAAPETPVATVARSMRANWIRHVPIVDEDGTLRGVISARDMLGVFLADPETKAHESWLSTVGPLPAAGTRVGAASV